MTAVVQTYGDVAVIQIPGESLDASNTKEMKAELLSLIASSKKMVFDLSDLKFVDSSGLGAILSCLRQMNSTGGVLKLCGMTKSVRALFELVRMHKIFDIYNTKDEAVRSF